ncbi:MAG TPA: hypothetical protein VMF13_14995 [Luteitalea sp.]|nr:hypothetical protein [Luteitalea sp.]
MPPRAAAVPNSYQSLLCLARVLVLVVLMGVSGSAPAGAQQHDHAASTDSAEAHAPTPTLCLICPSGREGVNTAWQPDTADTHGHGHQVGAWTLRGHAQVAVAYTSEGGPRGGEATYAPGFLMANAQRRAGRGVFGVQTMWTLEPTMGRRGYPLLAQTGETADGITALVDRQHPHDLPMELAVTYAVPFSGDRSAFIYAAAVGAPALGPPAFMHRRSGRRLPTAPITHHWFDASHVSFGVLTAGVAISPKAQIEVSGFRGREPDQHRWGFERPKIDSFSARLSVNPSSTMALQASAGVLHDAEQLHPGSDTSRMTVSLMYSPRWRKVQLDVTSGWGRNKRTSTPIRSAEGLYLLHGGVSQALLAEATLQFWTRHAIMSRVERVQKDELFVLSDPRHGRAYPVSRASLGYAFDVLHAGSVKVGIGGAAAWTFVNRDLRPDYGGSPRSAQVFIDLRTH